MKLHNIAFGNIKRRKSKMFFLVIGMIIGIATVIAIINTTNSMQQDVQTKLDEFGANIMIVPKTNTLSMSYGGMSIPGAQYDISEITENEIANIWSIPERNNLAAVSSKLLGAANINNEKVLLVGADLAAEIKLKKWWTFTNESTIELTRTQVESSVDHSRTQTFTEIKNLLKDDVIIGSLVAQKWKKNPGDTIKLNYKGINKTVSIKGILNETGSQDDSIIFMNLKSAQEFLGKKGKITLVEVAALCAGCPVEEIAAQINTAIPQAKATPIKQVVAQRMETISQLKNFGLMTGLIILFIGALIVFTTMSSSVSERIREIGIFRAIGFRKAHIIRIILTEAVVLSAGAGIIGYFSGTGIAGLIGPVIAETNPVFTFDLNLALASLGLAVLIGTLATLHPAIKASNTDPTEALRHI